MILGTRDGRITVLRRDADAIVVLVRGETELGSWPFEWTRAPDVSLANDLARLQLAARRVGCSIRLHAVGADLASLLDLLGLFDVMHVMG
jgi:hypothetical protein